MSKEFKYVTKIYYEDTDAGGVVYYANYLKFLERARSEAIYSLGLSNKEILEKEGVIIIVKSCSIEYKKPAKFEDEIEIFSNITEVKNSSLTAKILFTQKNREFVDTIFTNKEREKILFFCEMIALYG